jgi:hypothetical protein
MQTIHNLIQSFSGKSHDELLKLKDMYSVSDAPAQIKETVFLALNKILNRRELQEIAKIEISELKAGEI